MKIGIDVDGVIADNHTAWLSRYNRAHEDAAFTPDDLTQWEFWHDLLPGCTWEHLKSFWTPDIYEEVLPFPGSLDAIKAIEALGHEVHFITSCTRGWDEFRAKLDWLKRHGFRTGDPFEVNTWGVGPEFRYKSKEHVAQENGIDWLVDDHIPHVEAWPGHAYLMTRPHNSRLLCSRKRVKSLASVADMLRRTRAGDVLLVTKAETAPEGHTIAREKRVGNVFDSDGIQEIEAALRQRASEIAKPLIPGTIVEFHGSKPPVLDFAGKVDGGGVKGSQTDESKLPMWLIPSRFAYRVLGSEEGEGGSTTVAAEFVYDWLNDSEPKALGYAVEELVALYGKAEVLRGVARVLQYGAKKYAANNWRRGMKWSDVASAAIRHAVAIVDGEDNDAESGLPHWAHLGCCLAFLLEYTEHPALYAQFDDRFKRPVAAVA